MSKTVFVLGAGASMIENLPSQAEILKSIFKKEESDFATFNPTLLKTGERYRRARINIAEFIIRLFSNKNYFDFISDESALAEIETLQMEEKYKLLDELKKDNGFLESIYEYIAESKSHITLEDIFTILDKAIASNEHIQGYDTSKIIQLRNDFVFCIIRLFVKSSVNQSFDSQTYLNFIEKIIQKRIEAEQTGDPVSIITLNWDFIVDKYFSHVVSSNSDYEKAKLDYCVYDHNYHHFFDDSDIESIPSTILKRQGYYNVKLLKLHGAMNWLLCKNCQRLFYSQEKYIAFEEFYDTSAPECPFCTKNYSLSGDRNNTKLTSELITPTLLKNLDNVTFKNIWKNAFVELAEAEKVVFIGYSLPQADFEFRYMLKKAIRPITNIDVVLYHNDDPNKIKDLLKDEGDISKFTANVSETRFNSFFGKDDINFFYEGINDYVENHL
ncbi:hypothetical protein HF072_18285 [Bacillus sp. RO3]|nr:hypothetical protein [Bacillus sp. RO3]